MSRLLFSITSLRHCKQINERPLLTMSRQKFNLNQLAQRWSHQFVWTSVQPDGYLNFDGGPLEFRGMKGQLNGKLFVGYPEPLTLNPAKVLDYEKIELKLEHWMHRNLVPEEWKAELIQNIPLWLNSTFPTLDEPQLILCGQYALATRALGNLIRGQVNHKLDLNVDLLCHNVGNTFYDFLTSPNKKESQQEQEWNLMTKRHLWPNTKSVLNLVENFSAWLRFNENLTLRENPGLELFAQKVQQFWSEEVNNELQLTCQIKGQFLENLHLFSSGSFTQLASMLLGHNVDLRENENIQRLNILSTLICQKIDHVFNLRDNILDLNYGGNLILLNCANLNGMDLNESIEICLQEHEICVKEFDRIYQELKGQLGSSELVYLNLLSDFTHGASLQFNLMLCIDSLLSKLEQTL